jgi:hypothetical protein
VTSASVTGGATSTAAAPASEDVTAPFAQDDYFVAKMRKIAYYMQLFIAAHVSGKPKKMTAVGGASSSSSATGASSSSSSSSSAGEDAVHQSFTFVGSDVGPATSSSESDNDESTRQPLKSSAQSFSRKGSSKSLSGVHTGGGVIGVEDIYADLDVLQLKLVSFAERHRASINYAVKMWPLLITGPFAPWLELCPWVFDFDNKRTYFRGKLRDLAQSAGFVGATPIRLSVRRTDVFLDSYHLLRPRSASEMRGKLSVHFHGEEGVDAGGLVREWFGILAREIFNPNYCLFACAGGKASTFRINPASYINPDHLSFFHFCGRIIGKAVFDNQRLDAYFTRSFYKQMLCKPVSWFDIETEDPEFFKMLQWVLNTDLNSPMGKDALGFLTFTFDVEEFGRVRTVELVPGGNNKTVTEENKKEYVRLICEHKMVKAVESQVASFLKGFHEIIPADLVGQLFDDKELELLISGLPVIDLDDLRRNTDYVNYTAESVQIVWLWDVLKNDFSQETLAWFLQFVTGSTQVPLDGFKGLMGMRGPQKFSIHKAYGHDRLPTAHTCFNQLVLPDYPDRETLKQKLLVAVNEAHEGFGFI